MPRGYPKSGQRKKQSPENRCTVCRHPERARIEMLHCSGVGLDRLSEQFSVSRDAVWRHCTRHVTDDRRAGYLIGAGKIARLAEIAAEENQSLLDYFSILRSALFFQFDRLAEKGDHVGVSAIAQRLTDVLQQIGKITGQISTIANSTIINVTHNTQILNSPPFADLQSGLLRVCAGHPEVRGEIIALFRDLDAKYGAAPSVRTIDAVREATHG